MNFQWILLGLFAASMIWQIAKAMTNPMLKNILNLICIPVAFIFTFILQVCGVFTYVVDWILAEIDLAKSFAPYVGDTSNLYPLVSSLLSLLVTPIFFALVFNLLAFIFRLIHAKLVYKYIVHLQEKKATKSFEDQVDEEKEIVKDAIRDNEEQTKELIDALSDVVGEEKLSEIVEDTLDTPSKREINKMVERRVKKERRKLKRKGFFRESSEKKAISIVCGAVSGFLLFAISAMPFFYSMDFLSTITDGIRTSEADDSKVYKVVSVLDKHVVTPYEESFVVELYDNMAVIDLMNFTVKAGGRMVLDTGDVVYIDDVVKKLLTYGVRIAADISSEKSDHENLANDINVVVSDPLVINVLADFLVKYLADLEIPEAEEGDMMGAFLPSIAQHYKSLNKAELISDLGALTDTIIVAVESGLLTDFVGGDKELGDVLEDKETFGELIGSMSGLSVFSPLMDGVFTMTIDMVGPMLGVPANDSAAYDAFIAHIVTVSQGIGSIPAEDIEAALEFMMNASGSETVHAYITPPEGFDENYDPSTMTQEQIEEMEALIEEYEKRLEQLPHFITYFTNWMNAQKPFMVANEDKSSGCLTINVGGEIYVCNSDDIGIEDLLEMISSSSEESEEDGTAAYEELLKKIKIVKLTDANKADFDGRISPVYDLINFIIATSSDTMDATLLDTLLRAYVTVAEESESKALATRLLSENKDSFVYSGVTVEKMQASKKFGTDVWTDEAKEHDSQLLLDLIFTFIDMVPGSEDSAAPEDSTESEGSADDSESGDSPEALLNMLATLGRVMDIMADTTCLADLPDLMLDGLLKSEMLSMVMSPKMLHDLDGERENNPDFSYEAFLSDLAETFTDLLDKTTGEGGTNE